MPHRIEERYLPRPYVELKHPEWSKNATVYEVNIRQYTPEGTFKAFAPHLPRLKDMGIDILWLMPVHPIGKKNRKGSLGSYYAVSDYYGINPEFGTMDDFKYLVNKIHSLGMYVIIDWIANHTAWDNPLVSEHPEWYSKAADGNMQPVPWFDWDDTVCLDFNRPGIRKYMTEALKFWVSETNIDGYRCDAAGFVPVDFWDNARAELDAIKPVFMLAEWESRDLLKRAFDCNYSWSLWNLLHDIFAKGRDIGKLIEHIAADLQSFPKGAYRLNFTDNHDKNSTEGSQFDNFGEGLEAAIVFCSTIHGMPMVYSGQEAGLDRKLKFFDKDEIEWKAHPLALIFKKLFGLKHTNQAAWNGDWGGQVVKINNDCPGQVISFSRKKNGNTIISVVNFSKNTVNVCLDAQNNKGRYNELFSNQEMTLKGNDFLKLPPYGYCVLHNEETET